jgi:hypothetical protein
MTAKTDTARPLDTITRITPILRLVADEATGSVVDAYCQFCIRLAHDVSDMLRAISKPSQRRRF